MWKPVFLDGKPHVFRIDTDPKQETFIRLWLSDFRRVWLEELTYTELMARTAAQNSLIDFDRQIVVDMVVEKGLDERLHDRLALEAVVAGAGGAIDKDAEMLVLNVKSYVAGMPFRFVWRVKAQSDEVFFAEVTRSLLANMLTAQQQCTQLLDVIRSKDAEIEQYKLGGAELTRKHFETKPFDSPAYLEDQRHKADAFGRLLVDNSVQHLSVLAQICRVPSTSSDEADEADSSAIAVKTEPTSPTKSPAASNGGNLLQSPRAGLRAGHRQARLGYKFPKMQANKVQYGVEAEVGVGAAAAAGCGGDSTTEAAVVGGSVLLVVPLTPKKADESPVGSKRTPPVTPTNKWRKRTKLNL